ncbi:MAG TPA: sigma-70 family RNA polymerase sigma factor [Bryobacteraceae bacterium]|nr:sigma-70 family RNA polymerase sigma factor [Bryobacteraceae bacterium]
MSDRGEAELVEKLRNGDPDGLAAAYDRYGRVVYSLFVRITHDQSAAEDLVQELFLRLWNRRKEFDVSRGALGAWLISIARNMAIDYVRSAQARFQSKLRPIDQTDTLRFSYKPSEPANVMDSARAVQEALAELKPNHRKVLELAYFEGYSQSEIAVRLKEPLGTVKSWMRAALERLRVAVKGGAKGGAEK